MLSALPEREVDVVLIKGNVTEAAEADWILTDSKNSLGEWQEAAAMDHWKGVLISPVSCRIVHLTTRYFLISSDEEYHA